MASNLLRNSFYLVKPLVPRHFQIFLRRRMVQFIRKKHPSWPIDINAAQMPSFWKGWPEEKKFAFILQHDVDTLVGHDNVRNLMDVEEKLGVRSTFFLVPERYPIDLTLLDEIKQRGFGLGVHGLKHDGKLFKSFKIFLESAGKINGYLDAWSTVGFSSPSMLCRLEWMHLLNIEHSTATFDTDPFEPQPQGVGTIYPFFVKYKEEGKSFVEIPYTLPQDFTLFILMQEKDIAIWKKKLDWIAGNRGMALLNSHPDYMDFTGSPKTSTTYPVERYIEFVKYVKKNYNGQFWHALHSDLARMIKQRHQSITQASIPTQSKIAAMIEKNGNVCIIAKYPYPLDTRLSQQVNCLRRNGIGVDVICLRNKGEPALESDGTVTVHRLMHKSPRENFFGYLLSTGSFGARAFARLVKLSIKKRLDVIVVHTLPEFLVCVGSFHRLAGTALILDGRDLSVDLLCSRWRTWAAKPLRYCAVLVERFCTGICSEVITASPGFKRQLIKRGVPKDKISVMVNTADTQIFKFDEQRVFTKIDRNARFIYHGTVADRFGVAVAVEAMKEVMEIIPGSTLNIFGYFDNVYRAHIEKMIDKFHLHETVKLTDPKPLDEIYKEILTMDLGIVPYLSDCFMNLALSTKTFEYIASGLPVVSSRLKSTEELFSDNAIHFAEPGNPHDLAQKIVEMCENPELRKSKRHRAFQEFKDHTDEVVGEIYLQVIKRHLKRY